MVILPGALALSAFRQQIRLQTLQRDIPAITGLWAQYRYFVATQAPLTNTQTATLKQLLASDVHGDDDRMSSTDQVPWLVIPRLGTRSPWSSKATDIAHGVGLTAIKRLERGIVYYVATTRPLTPAEQAILTGQLHDPLTETVVNTEQEAAQLFTESAPAPLTTVPIGTQGRAALLTANTTLGLALTDGEIDYLLHHYQALAREPTDAELMMFAQANSEHCRHKIFNATWCIDGQRQPQSLFAMIRHTHAMNNTGVLSAYRDNAAVIEGFPAQRFYPAPANQVYGYMAEPAPILMKVETHNHPTAIAPWPGAATGAGGEIRDEGATGRGAKPKAGLTGFSVSHLYIPDYAQPWEQPYGKPQRIASALDIMLTAPLGSAAFNNEFGRPNVGGYFRTFEATVAGPSGDEVRGYHKPIMLAGGLGQVRPDHVHKGTIPVGAPLVVLGGPAMAIGVGGGAASSMASGIGQEALDFASVQRDNPEMQRRCQEVIDQCWQLGAHNPIAFIHDVGAGGLANALPELVNDGGRGARIQLRAIANDEPGMSPLALWCNEAQERYVLAVVPAHLERFQAICQRERCPYAIVGEATEAPHLLVEDQQFHNRPVDLPLALLLGKPPRMTRTVARLTLARPPLNLQEITLRTAVERVLTLPCVASKSFLITIGDRTITGLVYRDPMVGPWQVPVADCAVTATDFVGYTGEAMAMGERAPLALIDAPASGRMAIGEAITNIASTRIQALGDIKLSANWMAAAGHPGEDANLFDTVQAVAMDLCPQLGIAIPVGKDSLSMRTCWREGEQDKSVTAPLSLIISAFAPVQDIRQSVTPQLRTDAGDTALLLIDLGRGQNRLGGSALAQVYGQLGNVCPDVDHPDDLKVFFQTIQSLLQEQRLLAYHDRSDGGLLTTVLEMAFAGHTGVTLHLDSLIASAAEKACLPALFNEELGAVLQIKTADKPRVEALLAANGLRDCSHTLGTLNLEGKLCIGWQGRTLLDMPMTTCQRWWAETSYRLQALRDNPHCAQQAFDNLLDTNDPGLSAVVPFAEQQQIATPSINTGSRPQVAILREQGVNGQVEMAAAFDRAGFTAVDVMMTDLVAGRTHLDQFIGLVACGGFSYGDVLGAGQGWAKSILLTPTLRDQFTHFFARQETFTLGVCNGCQMLSHLRELIPGSGHWPYFTRNQSEQFEARWVLVKVDDSPSLFLQGMAGAQLPIPVAHGEGCATLAQAGQPDQDSGAQPIALRYVDHYGQVTERYPYNPNGSPGGIAGVTATDGRVTLMMPHPERAFRTVQHSWHPDSWGEAAPWQQLFANARMWVG